MSKAIVARPAEGVTINSEIEYLLNDNGEVQVFDSPRQATEFLTAAGVASAELRSMTIMESCGACNKCGSPLFRSMIAGYVYQCFTCDEDFYEFEQKGAKT